MERVASIAVREFKRTRGLFVFMSMIVLVTVQAIPETVHLIQTDHDGNVVHLDVTVDQEEKTVLAVVGDVSQYPGMVPTVNFHDYKTGFGVLKTINTQVCVLLRPLVPMGTLEKYRIGRTNEVHGHDLRIAPDMLSYRDVEVIAGSRIAAFCKDYDTYFAVATPVETKIDGVKTQEKRTKRAAVTRNVCVFSHCDSVPPPPKDPGLPNLRILSEISGF